MPNGHTWRSMVKHGDATMRAPTPGLFSLKGWPDLEQYPKSYLCEGSMVFFTPSPLCLLGGEGLLSKHYHSKEMSSVRRRRRIAAESPAVARSCPGMCHSHGFQQTFKFYYRYRYIYIKRREIHLEENVGSITFSPQDTANHTGNLRRRRL